MATSLSTFNVEASFGAQTVGQRKGSTGENSKPTRKSSAPSHEALLVPVVTSLSREVLPFVVDPHVIAVGEAPTGKALEAARSTLKPFNLQKELRTLALETDLRRTLRHKWNIYTSEYKKISGPPPVGKAVDYMAEFSQFATFQDAQTFCKQWNAVQQFPKPLSKIVIFKKGIQPIWEDKDNKRGGRFVVRGSTREETLQMFLYLVCRLVTGRLLGADYNDLCGAVLHAKGYDQLWIQLWNKDASDSDAIDRVKLRMNRLLMRTVAYQVHDQSFKMARQRTGRTGSNAAQAQVVIPAADASKAPQAEVEDFVRGFLGTN